LLGSGSGSTGVQSVGAGTNIVTGGTAQNPTISVSSTPSFTTVSAQTYSADTIILSGTNILSLLGSGSGSTGVQSVGAGTNIVTGGTAQNPSVSVSSTPSFTSVVATNLSGTTLFSGGTDVSRLFLGTATTFVQSVGAGMNVVTGGTAQNPTVSVSSTPSFTSVFSTNLSGTTLFSGNTDVSRLFLSSASTNQFLSTATTYVQSVGAGSNITTGGTAQNPTIAVSSNPSFTSVSATTISATTFVSETVLANALNATTLSGGTIFSGSTNISEIFNKRITSGTAAPSGGVDGDIYLQYT
jgi:hypothetical protein